MKPTDRQQLGFILVMGAVSGITSVLAYHIWSLAGIPILHQSQDTWCFLFSAAMFLFSALTIIFSMRCSFPKRFLRYEGYWSVTAIPYVLMLVSWQIWTEWEVVFSLFHIIWLVGRISLSLKFSRSAGRRDQFIFTSIVYFISALFVSALVSGNNSWLTGVIPGAVVCCAIAVLIRQRSISILGDNKIENNYSAGWTGAVALLSYPILQTYSGVTLEHLLTLMYLSFFCLISSKQWRCWGYWIAVPVLILPGLIDVKFCLLSFWVVVLISFQALRHRKERAFLEITGAMVLWCSSILGTVLLNEGTFLNGVYRYPIHWKPLVFSSLIDIDSGIMFAAPLSLLAVTGWIWSFYKSPAIGRLSTLSIPLAFIPTTAVRLMGTGSGCDPTEQLVFMGLLWPYMTLVISNLNRPLAWAQSRLLMLFNIIVSSFFFVSLVIYHHQNTTFGQLLTQFYNISDLDFTALFPVLNLITDGWNRSTIAWIIVFGCMILSLILELRYLRFLENRIWREPIIAGFFIITLLGLTLGTKKIQQWMPVESKYPINLNELNQSQIILLPETQTVWGIQLGSYLSNSVHIQQEQPIAAVRLFDDTGHWDEFVIRAGVETAELMYGRPDVMKYIKHRRPEIDQSRKMQLEDGTSFMANTYRSEYYLRQPRRITKIEIKMFDDLFPSNTGFSLNSIRLKIRKPSSAWGKPYPIPLFSNVILNAENPLFTREISGLPLLGKIKIVSNLANTAELPDGIAIAQLEIETASGFKLVFPIYSGLDTAEWSYDRPDMAGKVRHSRAALAMSKKSIDASGMNFLRIITPL